MKGLGATAAGGVGLAAFGNKADAATGGNGACAQFCTTALPPGKARGQCVSDAAHGAGLCYSCAGPLGQLCTGGNECNAPLCSDGGCTFTPTNEGGSCQSGSGACQSGSCVPTGGNTCAAGGCLRREHPLQQPLPLRLGRRRGQCLLFGRPMRHLPERRRLRDGTRLRRGVVLRRRDSVRRAVLTRQRS